MLADFILIGILIGFLFKGSFRNLAQVKFPYLWLIVVGFMVKFSDFVFPASMAHWYSTLGMGIVFLGTVLSWKLAGMKVVSMGAFLNILVIILNGGTMPVSVSMAEKLKLFDLIHQLKGSQFFDYRVLSSSTRLPFFSDILPYFSFLLFRPFVVSPGDYLLGFGLIIFIIFYMRRKTGEENLPGDRESPKR
ncbi:MAG: DUF5317 domain-containing protein [Candidatus Atribacteria bacterium]|nr:DUF5317 domain-containing protein [Candidatus Atribacteria bacterium]